jgi:hypothetical protein
MLYQLSYASAAQTEQLYQKRNYNCKGVRPRRSTSVATIVENSLLFVPSANLYPVSRLSFSISSVKSKGRLSGGKILTTFWARSR